MFVEKEPMESNTSSITFPWFHVYTIHSDDRKCMLSHIRPLRLRPANFFFQTFNFFISLKLFYTRKLLTFLLHRSNFNQTFNFGFHIYDLRDFTTEQCKTLSEKIKEVSEVNRSCPINSVQFNKLVQL